ncbi:MAG: hypothetical protein JNL10_10520 [Verrucomicrobiales bacterium]|nr:hypothetical protein [Verrucomicrobiales bacterium]
MARTRIFARPIDRERQVLVYQMTFAASEPVAMILPLPFKSGARPEEFKFLDLSAYPKFFSDLGDGFPTPGVGVDDRRYAGAPPTARKLEVFQVGSFEASFVPKLADFNRLDERFRLDPAVWRSLPGYDEMSFAVFQFQPGQQEVHPMAFLFPRRDPRRLFFPTLHIHDGNVHPREQFDHDLYEQGNPRQAPATRGWEESERLAFQFMKTELTGEILHDQSHVYRKHLSGLLKNEDTYVLLP